MVTPRPPASSPEPRHPEGDDRGDPSVIDAVDGVIRQRRTSLLVDPERRISDETICELLDAAMWAPNHKRTWPWSFTVLRGRARARLGEALAEAARGTDMSEARIAKLPGKYLRSAAVLLVWVRRSPDDPVRDREDAYATAAAVQTLLLAATARGLGSFWASIADPLVPATRSVAGVPDDHDLVALVYLGHPTSEVAVPPRPEPEVDWLD